MKVKITQEQKERGKEEAHEIGEREGEGQTKAGGKDVRIKNEVTSLAEESATGVGDNGESNRRKGEVEREEDDSGASLEHQRGRKKVKYYNKGGNPLDHRDGKNQRKRELGGRLRI